MINAKELWESGGYGKDNPLGRSITYVRTIGKEKGVPKKAVDAVIIETFIELSTGVEHSLTTCPCGCGIGKSGTAITHYMGRKVNELGEKIAIENIKVLEIDLNAMINHHVKKNKLKRISPFMDWTRSPVMRHIRKINGS